VPRGHRTRLAPRMGRPPRFFKMDAGYGGPAAQGISQIDRFGLISGDYMMREMTFCELIQEKILLLFSVLLLTACSTPPHYDIIKPLHRPVEIHGSFGVSQVSNNFITNNNLIINLESWEIDRFVDGIYFAMESLLDATMCDSDDADYMIKPKITTLIRGGDLGLIILDVDISRKPRVGASFELLETKTNEVVFAVYLESLGDKSSTTISSLLSSIAYEFADALKIEMENLKKEEN
jgi:hypothetical protein